MQTTVTQRMLQDHGSYHDLQHAVRWGAERFVAEQCEDRQSVR